MELQQQLDRLDWDLGRKAMLDYAKERMEALRQEARESGQQLEELDKLLFLCDEFSRCKVRYIEDQINGRFRLVKWKLFREQVNGGLADCCEATVDGGPVPVHEQRLQSERRPGRDPDAVGALWDAGAAVR